MLLRSSDLALLVSLNTLSLALDSGQRANARCLGALQTLNHKRTELSDFVIASNRHDGTARSQQAGKRHWPRPTRGGALCVAPSGDVKLLAAGTPFLDGPQVRLEQPIGTNRTGDQVI